MTPFIPPSQQHPWTRRTFVAGAASLAVAALLPRRAHTMEGWKRTPGRERERRHEENTRGDEDAHPGDEAVREGQQGGRTGEQEHAIGNPYGIHDRETLPRLERSEIRLREGLGPVRERFAVTVLDCPPSLGPVSVNALVAADRVIVPVQAEYLALEGLVQFLDTLAMIRREMNPSLDVSGLLITMHDERTRLAQDVERELREHFPEMVFETVIPRSVRVAEAPSYGLPVTEHAPSSRASSAYRALTEELATRG